MKVKIKLNKIVVMSIFFLFSIFFVNSGMVVKAADKINIQDVTVENLDFPFTGASILVEDYVVLKYGNQVLVKGTDYTIKHTGTIIGESNGTSVGTIKITGKGEYEGTLEKDYRIIGRTDYTLGISRRTLDMSLTGGTRKLNLYTTPSLYMDALKIGKHRYWTSSNPNVVTVDEYGILTPVGIGEATITAHYNGDDVTCLVSILQHIKGDVNQDGKVNLADAMEVINFYIEKKQPTDIDYEAGDMNNDKKLNLQDAMAIIFIYLEK